MNAVVLTLVLSSVLAAPRPFVFGPSHYVPLRQQQVLSRDALQPVVVVADGNPGWPSQQVRNILGELEISLASSHEIWVARFDAEPTLQRGFAVRGAKHDLVMIRPRTPMRDAVQACLALLASSPAPHTMIVIAREEFYSTDVAPSRLLDLARRSQTTIYGIHLAAPVGPAKRSASLGDSVRSGLAWTVERLFLRQRAYPARDTFQLLKLMSSTTGGLTCTAADEHAGIACASEISAAIQTPSQRVPAAR